MVNHYKDWSLKRKKYKRKTCVLCGRDKDLALHHHTYAEDDSLFATLCKKCHYKVHFNNKGKKLPLHKAHNNLKKFLTKKRWEDRAKEIDKIDAMRYCFNTEKRYKKSVGWDGMTKRGSCKP